MAGFSYEAQIRRVSAFLFCYGWNYDPQPSSGGMQAAAALINTAILQLVAFAAYLLREPKPDGVVGSLYVLVTAIPLVGLACLAWGRSDNMENTHKADRATVCLSWIGFWAILANTAFVVIAYAQEKLPFQTRPKNLEFVGARAYEFTEDTSAYGVKNHDSGIAASFQIDASSLPDPLVIQLTEFAGLPRGWQIVNALGFEIKKDGMASETSTFPVMDTTDKERPVLFLWSGLKGGNRYRLDVLLHPGGSSASVTEVLGSINNRKVLSAKAEMRD